MKQLFLLFTLLISLPFLSNAQLNNQAFGSYQALDSGKTGQIRLNIDGLGYFKNNEYFNDIVEGYTLFGYQFMPSLSYQPTPNISVTAGAFLQREFGLDGFTDIAPIFRLKYQKNRFTFLFGTLEGDLRHRLIEPIYNFERVISDRLEQGIQFRHAGKRFQGDWWINWREAITQGATNQEEIEGSWNMQYFLTPETSKWKFSLNLQSLILHRGGQINNSDQPVYTLQNHAVGFKLSSDWGTTGFVRGITLENYATFFSTDTDSLAFDSGSGIYLNGTMHTTAGDVMLSYWQGDQFVNPLGGDLYTSVSRIAGNPSLATREVILLRWMKDFKLSQHVTLSARAEPFYDLSLSSFEYSFGLYMNYRLGTSLNPKKPIVFSTH